VLNVPDGTPYVTDGHIDFISISQHFDDIFGSDDGMLGLYQDGHEPTNSEDDDHHQPTTTEQHIHSQGSTVTTTNEQQAAPAPATANSPLPTGRVGPPFVQLILIKGQADCERRFTKITRVLSKGGFATFRSSTAVISGRWQFEVSLRTAGVMQFGWTTPAGRYTMEEGIGDTEDSYAYDGKRRRKWNVEPESYGQAWTAGDIIGCAIDMDEGTITFSRNGVSMGVAFTDIPRKEKGAGYYAGGSFSHGESADFNFGSSPFQFPMEGCTPLHSPLSNADSGGNTIEVHTTVAKAKQMASLLTRMVLVMSGRGTSQTTDKEAARMAATKAAASVSPLKPPPPPVVDDEIRNSNNSSCTTSGTDCTTTTTNNNNNNRSSDKDKGEENFKRLLSEEDAIIIAALLGKRLGAVCVNEWLALSAILPMLEEAHSASCHSSQMPFYQSFGFSPDDSSNSSDSGGGKGKNKKQTKEQKNTTTTNTTTTTTTTPLDKMMRLLMPTLHPSEIGILSGIIADELSIRIRNNILHRSTDLGKKKTKAAGALNLWTCLLQAHPSFADNWLESSDRLSEGEVQYALERYGIPKIAVFRQMEDMMTVRQPTNDELAAWFSDVICLNPKPTTSFTSTNSEEHIGEAGSEDNNSTMRLIHAPNFARDVLQLREILELLEGEQAALVHFWIMKTIKDEHHREVIGISEGQIRGDNDGRDPRDRLSMPMLLVWCIDTSWLCNDFLDFLCHQNAAAVQGVPPPGLTDPSVLVSIFYAYTRVFQNTLIAQGFGYDPDSRPFPPFYLFPEEYYGPNRDGSFGRRGARDLFEDEGRLGGTYTFLYRESPPPPRCSDEMGEEESKEAMDMGGGGGSTAKRLVIPFQQQLLPGSPVFGDLFTQAETEAKAEAEANASSPSPSTPSSAAKPLPSSCRLARAPKQEVVLDTMQFGTPPKLYNLLMKLYYLGVAPQARRIPRASNSLDNALTQVQTHSRSLEQQSRGGGGGGNNNNNNARMLQASLQSAKTNASRSIRLHAYLTCWIAREWKVEVIRAMSSMAARSVLAVQQLRQGQREGEGGGNASTTVAPTATSLHSNLLQYLPESLYELPIEMSGIVLSPTTMYKLDAFSDPRYLTGLRAKGLDSVTAMVCSVLGDPRVVSPNCKETSLQFLYMLFHEGDAVKAVTENEICRKELPKALVSNFSTRYWPQVLPVCQQVLKGFGLWRAPLPSSSSSDGHDDNGDNDDGDSDDDDSGGGGYSKEALAGMAIIREWLIDYLQQEGNRTICRKFISSVFNQVNSGLGELVHAIKRLTLGEVQSTVGQVQLLGAIKNAWFTTCLSLQVVEFLVSKLGNTLFIGGSCRDDDDKDGSRDGGTTNISTAGMGEVYAKQLAEILVFAFSQVPLDVDLSETLSDALRDSHHGMMVEIEDMNEMRRPLAGILGFLVARESSAGLCYEDIVAHTMKELTTTHANKHTPTAAGASERDKQKKDKDGIGGREEKVRPGIPEGKRSVLLMAVQSGLNVIDVLAATRSLMEGKEAKKDQQSAMKAVYTALGQLCEMQEKVEEEKKVHDAAKKKKKEKKREEEEGASMGHQEEEEEEEEEEQVPEQFVCPISYDIMRDPVMLPSSRIIVDRSSIERHLMSNDFDPFSRAHLELEEVVGMEELREEIEEWEKKRGEKEMEEEA
jgi:Kip1 ubiquitination-promoting complex protein 1